MRDTSVPAHDGATPNTATRQWPRRDFIKVAAGEGYFKDPPRDQSVIYNP